MEMAIYVLCVLALVLSLGYGCGYVIFLLRQPTASGECAMHDFCNKTRGFVHYPADSVRLDRPPSPGDYYDRSDYNAALTLYNRNYGTSDAEHHDAEQLYTREPRSPGLKQSPGPFPRAGDPYYDSTAYNFWLRDK